MFPAYPHLRIKFRRERWNTALYVFVFLRWVTWARGIPKCIDAKTEADLPQDVRFDNEKRSDFEHSLHYAYVHTHTCLHVSRSSPWFKTDWTLFFFSLLELSLKKLAITFGRSWSDLDDFKRIFWKLRSPIAGEVTPRSNSLWMLYLIVNLLFLLSRFFFFFLGLCFCILCRLKHCLGFILTTEAHNSEVSYTEKKKY